MPTLRDGRAIYRTGKATRSINEYVVPLVERQYRLLEELRMSGPRGSTSRELAASLGVGMRTIQRDVAQLIAAGLPVRARRGPRGGYRFEVPAPVPPVHLSGAEAGAVAVALVAVGPY